MREMWLELASDYTTPIFYWQFAIILLSFAAAWLLNGTIHKIIMKRSIEGLEWFGGGKRILFLFTALVLVFLGKLILRHWQHTSLLTLVANLLMVMTLIRLAINVLRYNFPSSKWLKAAGSIVTIIAWLFLALHLSGFLPEVMQAIESVGFDIGEYHISLFRVLQSLVVVAAAVVAALSLSRFIENKLLRAEHLDMNLRVVMTKLVRILLTLAGLLTALSAVGFDITLLSVFGGAIGVGLGFGLQKIASNYVSGFIILLDKSLHLEDVITIGEHQGVVKQIRSRYMVLRKLNGTEVVVPNEKLISEVVINHTFTGSTLVILPLHISYTSELDQAMDLMREIARKHPRVSQNPLPDVQIVEFGENGFKLQLVVWISDPEEGSGRLKSDIYSEVWRAFKQHGISVPYPQHDIRIVGGSVD
jgi:small-conductance mechanosensitive channel